MALGNYLLTIVLGFMLASFNVASESISESVNRPVLRYGISPSAAMIPWDEDPKTGAPGIYREVVFLILAQADFSGEPVVLPIKRAIQALEDGEIDFDFVNPDWFPDGDVGPMFVTSVPILSITEWFITLPENAARFDDILKVYGNAVGTIRGFYYFDDNKFTRMDFDSQRALIGGLKRERFDIAILEEMTALYWSNELAINVALSAVHTDGQMVLRLHKNKAHLLPEINAAIVQLHSEGKIKATMDRYRKRYSTKQK